MSHWIRVALCITVFFWNAAQSIGANCVCTVWGSWSADNGSHEAPVTPRTWRIQGEQGCVTVSECPATGLLRIKYCSVIRVNLSLQKRLWQWIIPAVLFLVLHTVQSGGVKTFCFILMSLSVLLSVSVTVHFHYFVIVKWGQSKM